MGGPATGTGRLRRAALAAGLVLLVAGCADVAAGPAPDAPPLTTQPAPTEVTPVSDQRIRVELERSGGFTGLRRCSVVDTDSLSAAEIDQVRTALNEVDLDALSARQPNPRVPALDLVVVRDGRRTALRIDEASVPDGLRPLIQLLDQRAQPC